ncbi:hypothetical protein PRZ48_010421 [Zasmidium cellare]|uniref:Major facilitator superfamily (MFS) profile domain-containing protein n=1 Tax=Zasmidium cellare TaxID=395010 RepID=A0ABR0E916_ZASCE|nr:hypothetical protein PRZ48_010421 [Zasmidium cellare]
MADEKRSPSPSFLKEPHLQSIITHQPSNSTIKATTTNETEYSASRYSSRDELTTPPSPPPVHNKRSSTAYSTHRPVSSVGTRTNFRWSTISRDTGTAATNRSRWSTSTHGAGENNRGSMAITALPPLFFSPVPNLGLTPIPLPPKEPSIYDENVDGLARNWAPGKKWTTTLFVAWLAFISPLASSMVAPAVSLIREEFRYGGKDYDTFLVSVFIFGYVFGSLIAAPLSDVFGRKIVLDVSTTLFWFWELACALAPNVTSLLIFRLFAGLGASASLSVGGGVISDLFDDNTRGGATALFAIGPVIGPVIGPIAGGFLAEECGWRWIFWLLFILSAVTLVGLVAFNRETNPEILSRRKDVDVKQLTVKQRIFKALDWGIGGEDDRNVTKKELLRAMILPWKMLFTAPIVALLCIYAAFVYGLLYLLLTTITPTFVSVYGFSLGSAGLAYIGLGIGFLIAVAIIGGTTDRHIAKHKARNNGILVPERRLQLCIYFSFLIPVSFFWYGFTANEDTHWAAPIIGLAPFAIGMIGVFLPIQTYLIDASPVYAACSTAALASSRNVVGTFLPLAGPRLYEELGLDWGNATLGFIAVALIPVPALVYRYGAKLRSMSTWMRNEDEEAMVSRPRQQAAEVDVGDFGKESHV